MTVSVELAHVYREQLANKGVPEWRDRLVADWGRAAGAGIDPVILLFVDDYPDVYTVDEKLRVAEVLGGFAVKEGIPLDAIAYESDCAPMAKVLLQNLNITSEGQRWDNETGEQVGLVGEWLERHTDGTLRATLIERDGWYSCPALTAVWTLARLGEEPYHSHVLAGAFKLTKRFAAETVLTVLPVTYIDNEAAVVEVLRQLRKPRIPLSRVQYVFT